MSGSVQRKGRKQADGKAAGAVVRLEEVQQELVEVRGQKGLKSQFATSWKFPGKQGDRQASQIVTSEKTRGFPTVLTEEEAA